MNILIVDDDKLVSTSLKTILESDTDIHVIAIGNNGQEAITLYKAHQPDILLMDIRMDTMNGLDAAKEILKDYPDAKILLLTTFSDDEYILKAFSLGVKGYLLKQNFDSLITSIKAVYSGQHVFGNEIISKIPDLMNTKQEMNIKQYDITEKEHEIITSIANGLSNKEIADVLFLSEGTVRNYISIILEKLDLKNRTQIAIFYYKNIN